MSAESSGSGGSGKNNANAGPAGAGQAQPQISGDEPHRDRRSSQRVPIQMWVEELTDGSQVFRRAGNLSRGGLFLDKTIPIPLGSIVKLRFTLPGGSVPLSLDAKIVSIEPAKELGMGVQFVSVDKNSQQQIDDYLKQL